MSEPSSVRDKLKAAAARLRVRKAPKSKPFRLPKAERDAKPLWSITPGSRMVSTSTKWDHELRIIEHTETVTTIEKF